MIAQDLIFGVIIKYHVDEINRALNRRLAGISKTAGPGILFASTAIGVSHLIQSTRAGAEFGLLLIGFVIMASAFKYPFFEYGSRYANATGTSIIDGYRRLGRGVLWIYFLITVASMFFVTGAVGFVTAGFFTNLFHVDFLQDYTLVILFAICVSILAIGRYSALDSMIKIIAVVLLVSTVFAFAFALWNGPAVPVEDFFPRDLWDDAGIFFLLALMGWMPTALDLSSWNSLWTLERMKQTGYRPKLSETLFEFRLAYLVTAALAVMFITLGFYILGTDQELSSNNSDFAHQVVTMYTETIGEWSYLIISSSAFTIMFGTIIAVFDGYSRSVRRTIELLFAKNRDTEKGMGDRAKSTVFLLILATGSLVVVFQFGSDFRQLVDFATVLSFVIAPVIAIFNLWLVTGSGQLKEHLRPSSGLRILSYAGILFLAGFAVVFLATRLG